MNKPQLSGGKPDDAAPLSHQGDALPSESERPASGPNLALLYALLAFALAAAIGFAVLIVLPFYRRR